MYENMMHGKHKFKLKIDRHIYVLFNGFNSKIVTRSCFLQDSCTTSQGDWTPYNGNLHMQGIKVTTEIL